MTCLRRDHPRAGQDDPLPYLVALPTIGHGKGGNRRIPLPSARALLRAAHAAVRDKDDVDVAFLPYTPHSYEVLLQARSQLRNLSPAGYPVGPGAEGGPGLADLAAQVEEAVRGRHSVLFVGSGLSTAAGFPSWGRLNERLASSGTTTTASSWTTRTWTCCCAGCC